MNIVFAGTPAFAVPCLQALLEHGDNVVVIYTQPDRPAGRGQKQSISPVKGFAQQYPLPIRQPQGLQQETEFLQSLHVDVMVVVAYGLLIPKPILRLPKHGCINVHASLLPRWRGAAPIQRAIAAGDNDTGISIMQMDQGLDTGDILLQFEIPIKDDDTAGSLHDRLATLGAKCLIQALEKLQQGTLSAISQEDSKASYAHKLSKADAKMDWQLSAVELQRTVRALNPWPVAYCHWQDQRLRIWQAEVVQGSTAQHQPGTIIAANKNGIVVNTGRGCINLTSLQAEGGKPLTAASFLNGHPLAVGQHFT